MKFDYKVIRSFETAFKEFEKSKDNNMEIYNVDSISETLILRIENFLLERGAIFEIFCIGNEYSSLIPDTTSLHGALANANVKLKIKSVVGKLFKSSDKYKVYFYFSENKIVVEKI